MKFKSISLLFPLLLLAGCSDGPTGDFNTFILGLGNPSNVPAGQYAQKILAYYEVDEAKLATSGHVTYGNNVGEVTSWVKQGSVGAGVIYRSDATTYELKIVGRATKEMCGQVLYPAAMINNNNSETVKKATKSFLQYLTNKDAMDEFKKVGFVSAHDAMDIDEQVSESVTINVFAATSMTASMNAVVEKYKTVAPNVTVAVNYAASGTLQAQIENSVDSCDLFISAAQKQMNALQEENLIVVDSRFDILENEVCLCVPDKNPYNVNSFDDLVTVLKEILK